MKKIIGFLEFSELSFFCCNRKLSFYRPKSLTIRCWFYENQHKWNENLGVNKTLNTEERLKNQLPIKLIKSGCSHLHISHQNIRNRKTVKILLVIIIIIKNPCGMWAHSKIKSRNEQRYYNSKNWPGKEKTGIVILLQSAMRSWSLLQPLWAAASAQAPKVGKVPYDLLMSWRAMLSWKYLFL